MEYLTASVAGASLFSEVLGFLVPFFSDILEAANSVRVETKLEEILRSQNASGEIILLNRAN